MDQYTRLLRLIVFALTVTVLWLSSWSVAAFWLGIGPIWERELLLAATATALAPACVWCCWKMVTDHLKGFLIGVVVVFLCLLGGSFWLQYAGTEAYEREAERLIKLGGTIRLENMPRTAMDNGDDAAPLYLEAAKHMPPATALEGLMLMRIDVADARYMRKLLAKNRECIRIATIASRMPKCDWSHNFNNHDTLDHKSPDTVHNIARLFAVRSRVLGEDGDLDGAAASIETGLRIARHINMDPFLTARLRVMTIQQQMLEALKIVFSTRQTNLDRIEALLRESDHRADLQRAILAEVPLNLSRVNSFSSVRTLRSYWFGEGAVRLDLSNFLARSADLAERAVLSHVQLDAMPPLQDLPTWAFISRRLPIDYESTQTRVTMAEARLAMGLTALELRRYKGEHGEFPDRLHQIGDVPPDPWTGKSFDYVRERDGFVLTGSVRRFDDEPLTWQWEE